jgi:hypothetical protein
MCPGHFVVSFSENDLKVMPGEVSEGGGRLERMSIVEMCVEEELRRVEVMRDPYDGSGRQR